MDRATFNKCFRDLLVITVSSIVMYVGNNAADLGIPQEYVPLVSAAALGLYRILRLKVKGNTTPE